MQRKHLRPLAFVVAIGLVLSACTSGPASGPAPTAIAAAPAYKLGAGDKVRITTFDEPALTGEFAIGDGGVLPFPLLGQVQAGGLSVTELKLSLETALRQGYVRDPRISVEVLNYRPYYILGEVTKPGQYPYADGLTVLNAVAAASGFTYRANTKRVYIRSAAGEREISAPLTATTPVRPGDTIRIGERYF
jgi:polysaccharide export outer membrane protein